MRNPHESLNKFVDVDVDVDLNAVVVAVAPVDDVGLPSNETGQHRNHAFKNFSGISELGLIHRPYRFQSIENRSTLEG